MSRWKRVRAEYLKARNGWSGSGRFPARLSMRLAQTAVRFELGDTTPDGQHYQHCHKLMSAKPRLEWWGRCLCQTTGEQRVVRTYDDWGDGPQCTMCGRIKEV